MVNIIVWFIFKFTYPVVYRTTLLFSIIVNKHYVADFITSFSSVM